VADIETFASDFFLLARYLADASQDGTHNQLMFGGMCGVIRWRRPVEDVLATIRQLPGAADKQLDVMPYVAVPLAMMGPVETCFCRLDEHTLLWAGGEGVLKKRLAQWRASTSPVWHDAWQPVDGGLVTVVAAEQKYESPADVELPDEAQLNKDLFDQASSI
jgi:hypothetical protein